MKWLKLVGAYLLFVAPITVMFAFKIQHDIATDSPFWISMAVSVIITAMFTCTAAGAAAAWWVIYKW